METVPDFIFGGSKITADDDCSHEIKRPLLLGRKAMTNLDSILKSRNITLPMWMWELDYKKAEHWRIDAFELWCWRGFLRVPWTARRSNQSILKEISPEYSLEWLMLKLKLQYFGHPMQRTDSGKDPDAGKDWRWEEKGTTEDEMFGWHHWLDERKFEQALGVGDGQGSLASCSPCGCKQSDMTDWTDVFCRYFSYYFILFYFYWSIVDLQYYISFRCIT